MSLSDTRMNMIMKKLTAWAAIIAVPTAVTGYYGQNVPYPGFAQHWGFWASLIIIVGIAGALYLVFRRKDWL
jgi:magnesium transporter